MLSSNTLTDPCLVLPSLQDCIISCMIRKRTFTACLCIVTYRALAKASSLKKRAATLCVTLEARREVARFLQHSLLALRHDLVAQISLAVKGAPRVVDLPVLVPPLLRRRSSCRDTGLSLPLVLLRLFCRLWKKLPVFNIS